MRFRYKDLVDDLEAIWELAKHGRLLQPESEAPIKQLIGAIGAVSSGEEGRPVRLEIREELPIRSVVSVGEYEPGGRVGSEQLQMVMTGVWDVAPAEPRTHRTRRNRLLELVGIASLRSTFWRVDGNGDRTEEVGCWRIEIGDESSPGCHFHASVLGDTTAGPFPSSVSVPRFPSPFVSIGDAIEFTLGEFFQRRWRDLVEGGSPPANRWRQVQYPRMRALLDWQREIIDDSTAPSWGALKLTKPPVDLFSAI